jgi:hypothetical protein
MRRDWDTRRTGAEATALQLDAQTQALLRELDLHYFSLGAFTNYDGGGIERDAKVREEEREERQAERENREKEQRDRDG